MLKPLDGRSFRIAEDSAYVLSYVVEQARFSVFDQRRLRS